MATADEQFGIEIVVTAPGGEKAVGDLAQVFKSLTKAASDAGRVIDDNTKKQQNSTSATNSAAEAVKRKSEAEKRALRDARRKQDILKLETRLLKEVAKNNISLSQAEIELARARTKGSKAQKEAAAQSERMKQEIRSLRGEMGKTSVQTREAMGFFERMGRRIVVVTASFIAFKAALTAIRGGFNLLFGGIQRGSEISDFAARVGVATEKLSGFEVLTATTGASTELMLRAMRNVSRNMQQVKDGTGAAAGAFKELKIDIESVEGGLKKPIEVFKEVADVFSKMPDSAQKVSLAMRSIGEEAGPVLIPLLNQGAAGIERLIKLADQLGLVLTADAANALDQVSDNFAILGLAATGASQQIAVGFAPAMREITDEIVEVISAGGRGQETFREIGSVLGEMANKIASVVIPILQEFQASLNSLGLVASLTNLFTDLIAKLTPVAIRVGFEIGKSVGSGIIEGIKTSMADPHVLAGALAAGLGALPGILTGNPMLALAGAAAAGTLFTSIEESVVHSQGSLAGVMEETLGTALSSAVREFQEFNQEGFIDKILAGTVEEQERAFSRLLTLQSSLIENSASEGFVGMVAKWIAKLQDANPELAEMASNMGLLGEGAGKTTDKLKDAVKATRDQLAVAEEYNLTFELARDASASFVESQQEATNASEDLSVALEFEDDKRKGMVGTLADLKEKYRDALAEKKAFETVAKSEEEVELLRDQASILQEVIDGTKTRAAADREIAILLEEQKLTSAGVRDNVREIAEATVDAKIGFEEAKDKVKEIGEESKKVEQSFLGLGTIGDSIASSFNQVFDAVINGTLDMSETFKNLGLAIGKNLFSQILDEKFKFDNIFEGNILDLGVYVVDTLGGAFSSVFQSAGGGAGSVGNLLTGKGSGGFSLGGIVTLGGTGGIINLGGTGGGLNILGSGGGINLLGSGGGSVGNIGAGALGVLGLGATGASQFIATGTTAAALGVPAGTPIITTSTGIGASVAGKSLLGGGTIAGSSVPIASGPATSGVSGIAPAVSIAGSALGGAAGGITVYNLLAPGKTGLRGTAIQGIEGDILGNLNTAGIIGSGVGGAAAGVGAGIAAGAAAGSMAAPVIGTIAGALVGALFGVGTSQLSKGIDLQALETRKITGIDDLSTSAGIGGGLLTGFATAPGAFGYIQSSIMGDLLTGIPGLGLAIGPGGFRDFLFGLLGIPTVGTAMRRTTEGGLTSMGILERQGTQDRLLIDGVPNRLTEFDRENYRGRDFYSPEIGGLVRRLDRSGRLDDLLPGGRPVGLDNQGRSGSNLDDFGGDLLKMGRGLIGKGGTEQIRGLGLVIAEGIFGKDPDVSDRVLGHAKGLANIFTEMFASTLDEDSVGTGEMLETITRNARDYFETMGINAPAAFGLLQDVASDFFDEMEEGLVATGDKKWWEDPSGLDMLKSSASGLVQTFANDLPKGVELGSLVFDSLRVSGEKSMADISQSTQDAIATFSGGEGSGSFSEVFQKAIGNLEIPSGMGGKLFDTFSDEAKAKLDALSQDTELWAETLVSLLGSGFEIDLDHLFHRIADINASVMFLNEQLPSAIQQVSALGGDAEDVTNSVFENIKQQAYAAFKEVQSLNFQEAILGNEETGVKGITNDALEPVMNVLRRLTTTDEFDLSSATGVAEFNKHLNFALALGKKNLKELQPEIQVILDAAEEADKIIEEAFAPSEIEAFFQEMAIGAEEANREFEAGLLGAIDAGKNAMRDALGDGASVWEAIQHGGDVFVNTMSANLRAQVFNAMTSAILEAAVFETTIGPAIEQLKVGVGAAMEDGVLSSDEVIWLSAFAENIISQGEMAVEALRPLFESLGLIQIEYEGGPLPSGPRPAMSEADRAGLKELEGITPAELRRERDRLFYEEVGKMSPEKRKELSELEGQITRGEVTISGNRVFGSDGRLLNPSESAPGSTGGNSLANFTSGIQSAFNKAFEGLGQKNGEEFAVAFAREFEEQGIARLIDSAIEGMSQGSAMQEIAEEIDNIAERAADLASTGDLTAENAKEMAQEIANQATKAAAEAKKLEPFLAELKKVEALKVETGELGVSSVIADFAIGGSSLDQLDESLTDIFKRSMIKGIVDALLAEGPIKDAMDGAATEFSTAMEEAMADGVISEREARELELIAKRAADNVKKVTKEATDTLNAAFGPSFAERVEEATKAIGQSTKSEIRNALLDPNLGYDHFEKSLKQGIFNSVVDGMIDAFLQTALFQGALAPVMKLIERAMLLAMEGSFDKAFRYLGKATKELGEIFDDPELKKFFQELSILFQEMRSELGLTTEDLVSSGDAITKAGDQAIDQSEKVCGAQCNLVEHIVDLGEAQLNLGGRGGESRIKVFAPPGVDPIPPTPSELAAQAQPAFDAWLEERWASKGGPPQVGSIFRDMQKDFFLRQNPQYQSVEAQFFGTGGFVTSPTLAVVGESEPEYILRDRDLMRVGDIIKDSGTDSTSDLKNEIRDLKSAVFAIADAINDQGIDVTVELDGEQIEAGISAAKKVESKLNRSSQTGGA